jgi:hypothetical protein
MTVSGFQDRTRQSERTPMSKKTTKRLLLWGMPGLLILAAIFGVWATHGFLWSIYTPIYDRLLYSFPSPPGLLPETDEVTLNPELPWGYRRYEVDKTHEETVNFFIAELPRAGWDSVEHDSRSIEREPGVILEVDDMLLVNRQQYWLIVVVYTDVDVAGVRIGNSLVTLEIHRNGDRAKSRYSP